MTTLAQTSNVHFSCTDSTTAVPEKIWQIWTDVENWKQWDKGLQLASIDGDFAAGTKGKLLPDKGPAARFIITAVHPGSAYTFKTKIPLGWLVITRTLKVIDNRTFFTHEVQFTGLLKHIFGRQLGRKYRTMLPEVLHAIKKLAEAG